MKLKKCVFSVVMFLLLCACFVLNSSSGFAVARYVEVYDDASYEDKTYSAGTSNSDYGKISCQPLKATYTNDSDDYKKSFKEVVYKLYKVQSGTNLPVITGTKSKEGSSYRRRGDRRDGLYT